MPAERGRDDRKGPPLRLFFAVPLSAELQRAVSEVQDRLRAGGGRVKWVAPENLHFTLKFLGDVPPGLVSDLERVGHQTGAIAGPVGVELAGVGAFPSPRNPRVVWLGAGAGADTLESLAQSLTRALREAGLTLGDNKPFAAHCTIGRCKQPDEGDLKAALTREATRRCGWLEVTEFHLVRSELAPAGPTYTSLARFPLGGQPRGG